MQDGDEDEDECLNAHSPSIGASANMRPPGHAHTGHPESRPAAIALTLHTATGLQLQLQVGRCRLQGQHRSGSGWQRQRQRRRRITPCGSSADSQNTQDRLRKFWLRRVRRPWPNHVPGQPGTQVDVEEQARHSLHAVLCIPRGSRAPVSSY